MITSGEFTSIALEWSNWASTSKHMRILSWSVARKFLILHISDQVYKAILDLLVMWSLKVRSGSSMTPRNFMFCCWRCLSLPTLRDGTVCLSKLYLVSKTMNFVFQSFSFKLFSIIHFLTLFTLLSRFSEVLPGLKDTVREWSSAYPDMLLAMISSTVLE